MVKQYKYFLLLVNTKTNFQTTQGFNDLELLVAVARLCARGENMKVTILKSAWAFDITTEG
jgi:hypothetical protein